MKPKSAFKHLIAALVAIAIVGPSSTWAAGGKDQNKSADGAPAGGADMYMPPKSFTSTIQLKEHIIRLQKVPLTQRQSGYSEALVSTADKILESNPPDSREFAVLNLLDGLHHWADVDKNAEADKRLAELSTKYSTDANKKIALAAAYFALEQKVINPSELKHEEIPKVLDEAKAALNGKALAAKHERMCNGTNTLINYLDTDEEAERRFKDFSRIFATSTDQNIAKLGNTMRTAKRDPSVVKTAEKPAAIATTSPADPAAMTPAPEKIEPAEDWVKRMEAKIVAFAGPEHDEEYLKEKSKFLEKYPSDPLRWRWSIMDARRAMKSTGSREEQVQRSRSALAEVIGAGNVSDELREQASTMNLKLDVYLPTSMAELAQHCADHVGRFPNSKLHVDLMKSLVASVVKGLTSEQAIPKLEELKQAGIEQLNQAVDAKIAELQKQTSATN